MAKPEDTSAALAANRRDPELLNLLAAALEAAHTAVCIVDRDRTIVWANPAVEPLSGFTPREIIGQRTPAYWSSRQTPAFYEELFRTLLAGQKWRGELAVNAEGRIERLNVQAERVFGYSRSELLGELVETVVPGHLRLAHPEGSPDGDWRQHANFAPSDAGLRGRRKDGSEFPVQISLSLLQTHSGSLVLSVVRDVTLPNQAEKELKEAHERLNIALRNVERQSREAAKLSELVDVLQSCPTLREAYEVTAASLGTILPHHARAVCITNASRSAVEVMAS